MKALDAGDVEQARRVAHDALTHARQADDRRLEAHSLSCLAHCDRLASRFRRSYEASLRAVRLLQAIGDTPGEVTALTTLAHASAVLGRNEESVEAALLAVKLAEPGSRSAALALNSLGIAYGWSGSLDEALACFDHAMEAGRAFGGVRFAYQPRISAAVGEAMAVVKAREHSGTLPPLDRLEARVSAYRVLERAGERECLLAGLDPLSGTFSSVMAGLLHCWRGEIEAAERELATARSLSGGRTPGWALAMSHWLAGEIHWAAGRMTDAGDAFGAMRVAAAHGEHEQLVYLAHLLASLALERHGRHDLALAELRRLRQREQQLRAERLESRANVVAWQINVRQSEIDLQRMEAASRRFERLSLEDPLTGLANRRCFEIKLEEQLSRMAATGEPVSVAFIDIDRFKQVNDRFTHTIGDRVLKGVAQILQTSLRAKDTAARLAGDEFVVLFARTAANEAAAVCRRIKDAARDFGWEAIARGLEVSLSVGVAQASEDDTVEALLHRSDASMYRDKNVDKTSAASGEP